MQQRPPLRLEVERRLANQLIALRCSLSHRRQRRIRNDQEERLVLQRAIRWISHDTKHIYLAPSKVVAAQCRAIPRRHCVHPGAAGVSGAQNCARRTTGSCGRPRWAWTTTGAWHCSRAGDTRHWFSCIGTATTPWVNRELRSKLGAPPHTRKIAFLQK